MALKLIRNQLKSTEIDYFAELFLIVISRTLIRPAYLEGRFGL